MKCFVNSANAPQSNSHTIFLEVLILPIYPRIPPALILWCCSAFNLAVVLFYRSRCIYFQCSQLIDQCQMFPILLPLHTYESFSGMSDTFTPRFHWTWLFHMTLQILADIFGAFIMVIFITCSVTSSLTNNLHRTSYGLFFFLEDNHVTFCGLFKFNSQTLKIVFIPCY